MSAHSSTFSLPISYNNQLFKRPPSSWMPIATHTERVSHWLAVHFRPKSSSAYYFVSYGIVSLVPSIQAFTKRICTAWDYNKRVLEGLKSDAYEKYCCLCTLYIDWCYTRNNSSPFSMFGTTQNSRLSDCSLLNSGPRCRVGVGVNAAAAACNR